MILMPGIGKGPGSYFWGTRRFRRVLIIKNNSQARN